MAGWTVSSSWSGRYAEYRASVQRKALEYEGRTEDCADLSLWLLIDFASWHYFPVSLQDNRGTEYSCWASSYSNRYQYYDEVKRRIGAHALYDRNTVANPNGAEPGDLLLQSDHAAIIFAVYTPGVPHALAADTRIPDFPGPDQAARQLTTTRYLRSRVANGIRVDYLNHRGSGKERAELIFNAPLAEMTSQRLRVRMYNDRVLRDPPPPGARSTGSCSVGLIGR